MKFITPKVIEIDDQGDIDLLKNYMSKTKLKIIFFGLGSIGQRHLQNISKLFSDLEIYSFKKNNNNFLIRDGKKILK